MFKRYWWMFLAMVPVGMIAGLFVAAVITYVMPRQYESATIIEIKPPPNSDTSSSGNLTPPNFYPNEFAKLKGSNTLKKVVESLELANKWGMDSESAVQILKRIVTVANIKGTDLCSIRVLHTNREDARDIAAGVASAYRDYRGELAAEETGARISGLRKAIRDQEDRVEESRKVLTTIARIKGVAEGDDPVDKQDYLDATRGFETELSLLEKLKIKLITAEIDLGLADEGVVVHEDAVIAETPTSPNVRLNFLFGLAGGVLLSPFMALPLMSLMHQRNKSAA